MKETTYFLWAFGGTWCCGRLRFKARTTPGWQDHDPPCAYDLGVGRFANRNEALKAARSRFRARQRTALYINHPVEQFASMVEAER